MFVCGLIIGGMVTAYLTSQQIGNLKDDISKLNSQISGLSGSQYVNAPNVTIYYNSSSLAELYETVKDSVVLVHGTTSEGDVQGSGFVYNFSGTMVIITNNHVVHGTSSLSVSFSNGNGYEAKVNGTDPYADLAVVKVDAPADEFKPLDVVSSSTLKVGEPVIAIGNPYGLVGSLTTGVVSALGRTITEEEYTGGFSIANIIQTSTPINPGNSGGPLLNYLGKVVGITTAIIQDSQGLGFAIPSNTILKEIYALITNGTYEGHSYLGVHGSDMDYETARTYDANVTYGWRIAQVVPGDPSFKAGVQVGDIIIGINMTRIENDYVIGNGTRVRNGDEMSSYLEEHTIFGQTVTLNIARGTQRLEISVQLGKRPPPP
jgi:S1-C subfamily serine protease